VRKKEKKKILHWDIFTDFSHLIFLANPPIFHERSENEESLCKAEHSKKARYSKDDMASHTAAELLTASMAADLPQPHIRRPSTFLPLAPTTSASYPQQRPSPPASIVSPKVVAADVAAVTAESATAVTETAPLAAVEELDASAIPKSRRSSSLASNESGNSKLRFLKLGPVHFGEGDGKGDWSEGGVTE